MFNFLKKKKKTQEELKLERQERYRKTMATLELQEQDNEKKKNLIVKKIKESQAKGLPVQEKIGRKKLASCITFGKRISAMKLNLEYAMESKDMAALTKDFLACIKDIGEDIRKEVAQTDTKAGKSYDKAMFEIGEQTKMLDDILESNELTMNENDADGIYSAEVNEEIDALLGTDSSSLNRRGKISEDL